MIYQKLVIQLLVRIVSMLFIMMKCDDKIDTDKLLIDARNFIRNA